MVARSYTFERTADYGLVEILLSNPRAYRFMANDQAPPLAEFKIEPGDYAPVICRSDDGLVVGLFLLVPRGGLQAQVHFCFAPGYLWSIIPAGKAFIEWVWREMPIDLLIAGCPSYNKLALRAATGCGLRRTGYQDSGVQRHGKPVQLIVATIQRPSYFGQAGARALPS